MTAQVQVLQLLPLLLLLTLPATGEWGEGPAIPRDTQPHHAPDHPPSTVLLQAQTPCCASHNTRSPLAGARACWGEVYVWRTAVSTLPMPSRSMAVGSASHAGSGELGWGKAKRTVTQNLVHSFFGTSKGSL
jgi:hypothetical protein